MNFPNILSVSRIFLSIPIIILFENESYLLSIIFFIIASVTDYLDGFLARKQNLVTKTGALLDLLADKIFVSVILIWMTFTFESVFILVASILIISREIAVSYLRLFIISNNKETREVQPDLFGKLKKFSKENFTIFIICLFICINIIKSDSVLYAPSLITYLTFLSYSKNKKM